MNDLQKIHSAINNSKGGGTSKYIFELPFAEYQRATSSEDTISISQEEYIAALECIENGGNVYLHLENADPMKNIYFPFRTIGTMDGESNILFGIGNENFPDIVLDVKHGGRA